MIGREIVEAYRITKIDRDPDDLVDAIEWHVGDVRTAEEVVRLIPRYEAIDFVDRLRQAGRSRLAENLWHATWARNARADFSPHDKSCYVLYRRHLERLRAAELTHAEWAVEDLVAAAAG